MGILKVTKQRKANKIYSKISSVLVRILQYVLRKKQVSVSEQWNVCTSGVGPHNGTTDKENNDANSSEIYAKEL